MNETKIMDEIEDKIGRDDLCRYLCGEFGERIFFDIDDQIVTLGCPGWNNIDEKFYVWEGITYDNDHDCYFDEDENQFTDLDLIQMTCEEGDVTKYLKELQDMIREAIRQKERQKKRQKEKNG